MRLARTAALVLSFALLSVAVSASLVGGASGAPHSRAASTEPAFVAGYDALNAGIARLERDQLRETHSSPRGMKHLLAFAVLLAALCAALADRRGAAVVSASRPPRLTWSVRGGGRAPPSFLPSVP